MHLLSDIWSVLTPQQRRRVIGAQFLAIAMAFSTIAGIASIAPFFSVLGNPRMIDESPILHWLFVHFGFAGRRSFEVGLGIAFVALVLVSNLINALGTFIMVRLAWSIGADLQSTLFGEYLRRPYSYHVRTHSAVLFNNIIHETNRATNEVLQNTFLLVANVITAFFIITTAVLLNPLVAAAMIFVLAGGYVLIYLSVRKRLSNAGEAQSYFYIEQTKIVNESLAAIKEILVLRIQSFFNSRFEASSRAFGLAAARTQVIGQSPRHVMECVAVAGLVLVALIAAGRDEGLGPWLGKLTFLGFAAYRLLPTLQQTFAAIVRIRADRAGFASVAPDLRRARAATHTDTLAISSWQASPEREIRLREVSFRYETDRPPAVAGVSLHIPARKAVGLVGANGSGKTTLVDLIAGLLPPETGRVEIDGIALDDGNRAAWQSRIAYVPQNIVLLDATIGQNIALGIPAAAIDKERLAEATRLAHLDGLISTLPDGMDHAVGERGVKLSGGQRQRIGIARALYSNASVLILDEATNALDGLTEQELMATIMRLRGRYTVILIAHRLSAVSACDVIFEIEGGRIMGCGTYDGLLRTSKAFRQLANVS